MDSPVAVYVCVGADSRASSALTAVRSASHASDLRLQNFSEIFPSR
jgi:hypothetical protein